MKCCNSFESMMQRPNLIETILVVLWVVQLFKITDSIDAFVVMQSTVNESSIPTSKREVIDFQIVDHESLIYFCTCTNKQLDLH